MNTVKLNKEEAEVQGSGCCSASRDQEEKNTSCCEQPSDASSCCDKSETKEVNGEKRGCC